MSIQILVDDRERQVIEEMKKINAPQASAAPSTVSSTSGTWWIERRLSIGDYALVFKDTGDDRCGAAGAAGASGAVDPKTFMIIERKTYADFANSLKDGRIYNMGKLIGVRNDHPNIRLALILEGTRPMSERELVAGVQFKCIRAKIAHLWLRDDIYLIETHDAQDTALRLRALVEDIESLQKKNPSVLKSSFAQVETQPPTPIPIPVIIQGQAPLTLENLRAHDERTGGGAKPRRAIETQSCIAASSQKKRTIVQETHALLCRFGLIGPKTGDLFISKGISPAQVVNGNISSVPADAIKIFKRIVERYQATRTDEQDAYIISSLTGLTKKHSVFLIGTFGTLRGLCEQSRAALSELKYEKHGCMQVHGELYDCLHYGRVPEEQKQ